MAVSDRREREKQHRINAIMEAALEVFSEKGLKNTTMDDIADKSELSKGTIYLYFKSKEHLFFAINMRAGQMLKDSFAEAARSATIGADKVRSIGRAYYRFCFDYPNYFKAMSFVENMDPETYTKITEEMRKRSESKDSYETSLTILADAIKIGQEDGSISKDLDPWLHSILLWSLSNGVIGMIKNRERDFEMMGIDVDSLYKAKETLVGRGMAPVNKDDKK